MRINYKIPERWNDLNDSQLKRIGKVLSKKEKLHRRVFISLLISIMLTPNRTFFQYLKALFLFSEVPLKELENYCSFIFEDKDRLTRFIKSYKIKGKIFLPPSSRLANITIEEFSFADAFFYSWATEGKEEDLHRLVAVLYREQDEIPSKVDPRVPFNKLLLPDNANFTDKIPLTDKLIIALAFQGCRAVFADRFPVVFPKPKKSDEENSETTEVQEPRDKKKKYIPFSKVINAMVMDEVQIFGTLQQTEKTNASDFLNLYQESILKMREREHLNQ